MRIAAAWAAAACGACGLYFGPSSPAPDGAGCAPEDDPIVATGGPGPIDVHLDGGGAIVLEDADGARTMTTDAHGDLTATIRPPAIVTGVSADLDYFGTITGVEPGDHLCLSCRPPSGPHDPMNDIRSTITVPVYPAAQHYLFHNGENLDEGGTSSLPIPSYVDAPHDVAAVALDDNYRALAWTMTPAQTLTDGGVIALDGWQEPVAFTASYDHISVPLVELRIARAERSSADALPAFAFNDLEQVELGATTATATTPSSNAGSPLMTVISQLSIENAGQGIYETVPASSSYQLDASQALMHWIGDISYDPCAHTLRWSESSDGLAPDGTWASIQWGSTPPYAQWWVLLPPGATSFHFPDLPPGAPAWSSIDQVQIWAYDVDAITTYAAMRGWRPSEVTPATRPHRYESAYWRAP